MTTINLKRVCNLLIALTLLAGCGNSQRSAIHKNLTGNIKVDLANLLPNGKMKADIMDGVKQNARQIVLTNKFQMGIKENYEWFLEYMKTVPEGEPMPFHSKLGMTESEYSELMSYLNNIELVSTGVENIIIEVRNDTIHFKSSGKLSEFDSLKIDLKNNVVLFKEYKLTFSDTTDVTTDTNGLKSKWKGYNWEFNEPKNLDFNDLKDLENLKMKQYDFTIAVLEKNGKTYMSLKGREVEDGAKYVDFELPVIF